MQNSAFAAISRSVAFFGAMAAIVAGLTFGAPLQQQTDESSATIAALREQAPAPAATAVAGYAAAPGAAAAAKVDTRQALASTTQSGSVLR